MVSLFQIRPAIMCYIGSLGSKFPELKKTPSPSRTRHAPGAASAFVRLAQSASLFGPGMEEFLICLCVGIPNLDYKSI